MSIFPNHNRFSAGRLALPALVALAPVLALLGLLAACSPAGPVPNGNLTTLRVGVLPDESPEKLRERHEPLVQYLSQELGLPVELILPDDYAGLVKLFRDGKVDLAYFGGLTFVQATREAGAVPLVMRDVDTHFTSYFLVHPSQAERDLESYRDATFAFGSASSTSGHLMPRFFLQEKNMEPETFFGEIRYSGAHDTTAYWVRDGKVEIGAANSHIIDAMQQDGRLQKGDIHILQETPPYSDYVWAVQPTLSTQWQIKIRDAFLQLSPAEAAHTGILARQNAGGFLPADRGDFVRLEKIIDQVELLTGPGTR